MVHEPGTVEYNPLFTRTFLKPGVGGYGLRLFLASENVTDSGLPYGLSQGALDHTLSNDVHRKNRRLAKMAQAGSPSLPAKSCKA